MRSSCAAGGGVAGTDVASVLRLTPAVEDELQWLAAESTPSLARHARIILGLAKGMAVSAVAASVDVHTNTVRNCLRRFEQHGLKGLGHRGVGKTKNQAFTESVRDEVARVAMHSPAEAGEVVPAWSLRSLRHHLLRRGVVDRISVEGLRQLLRGLPLPVAHWQRRVRPTVTLSPEVRQALESLRDGPRADRRIRAQIVLASMQGLNETEIAIALHVGRATVRRWAQRFRRAGILGLETLPRTTSARRKLRQQIASMTAASPRRYGINRDTWTVPLLRRTLVRDGFVAAISLAQLHQLAPGLARPQHATQSSSQPPRARAAG